MRSELLSNRIVFDEPTSQSKKRRNSPEKSQIVKQFKPRMSNQEIRTFLNLDGQTCWINCSLQLVLAALDHTENCKQSGSPLWDHLISLKLQENSRDLNALPIRNLMIRKEVQQI